MAVTAGGDSTESQGMEEFNYWNGSVRIVTPILPHEVGSTTGLRRAKMISINEGKELLVYGGITSNTIFSGIWKYSVKDDIWSKIGKMFIPRIDHAVIEITGIDC